MADKQVPLSIIIRTVDKATAGIEAINKKLDELTKPTREFGKALKELGEKSGFNKVSEAFGEVGKAAKETFVKLLEGAAIIGEVTHLVLEMVEGFSSLNDTAERVGTSVDFLAGLRYGASKSGSSIEKLDQGLTTFVENLGGLKAGAGKLTKFLGEVAPTMLKQLQATRTTEEALGILAAGMEKLTNKSKQLKFAQEALGDPSLAALFHRGPAGIMELMAAYAKLAGPQQEAAERAAKVDDALKDLHASTEGVKAALVSGLSPALTEIIDKLTLWLSGHRGDVEKWAEDIGKKLPKAVEQIVAWLGKAYTKAEAFIDKIGGLQTVALALAASITGPLIASIVSLGIAMMSSPAGLVLAGLGALALGIAHVATHENAPGEEQAATASETGGAGTDFAKAFHDAEEQNKQDDARARLDAQIARLDAQRRVDEAVGRAPVEGFGPEAPVTGPSSAPSTAKIVVDFTNAPKGMRATVHPSSTADVDLSVGHNMGGAY